MKQQLDILAKLQKIETETSDIKATLGQVSKKLETLDDELRAFEQALADEESNLDELKKTYRNFPISELWIWCPDEPIQRR